MTLGQLNYAVQKLLALGADPETPVYVSDSRNGETNRAHLPFVTASDQFEAGDVLLEESPKIVLISNG